MKKKLRILVLVDKRLIPPKDTRGADYAKASWRTEFYVISTLKSTGYDVEVLGVESDLRVIRNAKEEFNPHIAFNLLEEFDGECVFDQNVVSYLELVKLPYSGCNPKGLILSRDKALSKTILSYHRIKTPGFAVAKRGRKFKRPKKLEFPLIVKSLFDEGSTGISQSSIVNDDTKLAERIEFVHNNPDTESDAIVESYIEGRELYVSLMGNHKIQILPIIELEFKKTPDSIHQIATGKVKWDPAYRKKYGIDIDTVKNFPEGIREKIIRLSKRSYRLLGLNGYARIDLRLTKDGEIYFLEANPNPDIAKGDEFAYSAKRAGINYPELLNKIVNLGLSWNPASNYH